MSGTLPVVPYDPELGALLASIPLPPFISADMIAGLREAGFMGVHITAESVLAEARVAYLHHEYTVPRPDGEEIILSVFSHRGLGTEEFVPCVYNIHGGGMVLGNRFGGAVNALQWAAGWRSVVVSVEYRLAPEHADPVPVEDCYAGLAWVVQHADELGVDVRRILVAGSSAGGGLAAGVALLARDRDSPALCGQLLNCPMLDDRMTSVSSRQYVAGGLWNRQSNMTGWTALLGARRGGADVSIYAAPARAEDLRGLPPAFIDVGSADMFRDEDVAYAQKLWAHGVQAELHVWPGGFHIFDSIAPTAALSVWASRAQRIWVERLFQPA